MGPGCGGDGAAHGPVGDGSGACGGLVVRLADERQRCGRDERGADALGGASGDEDTDTECESASGGRGDEDARRRWASGLGPTH